MTKAEKFERVKELGEELAELSQSLAVAALQIATIKNKINILAREYDTLTKTETDD